MKKERLVRRIDEWKEKVANTERSANTYRMVKDIDKILAEGLIMSLYSDNVGW